MSSLSTLRALWNRLASRPARRRARPETRALHLESLEERQLLTAVPFIEQSPLSPTGDAPTAVATADLDRDGDLDIVAAFANDNRIAWFENSGGANPSFTMHTISTAATGASDVLVADIDRDGFVDVVSASAGDGKIAWYQNNGADLPTFTEHLVTTSAAGVSQIAIGDLDHDYDADILAVTPSSDTITWYEHDGAASPSFAVNVVSTTAVGVNSIAIGDFNRDGHLDFVAAHAGEDKLAWYKNDGLVDPVFTRQIFSSAVDNVSGVAVGDVDGDGHLDVIAAVTGSDDVVWFENDGATAPDLSTMHTVSGSFAGTSFVTAADLDSDGDLDIIAASATADTLAWFENTGAGASFTLHTLSTTADNIRRALVTDLDSDADLDVISVAPDSDAIAWVRNETIHGSAVFVDQVNLIKGDAHFPHRALAWDFDRDGDTDFVYMESWGTSNSGSIWMLLNTGTTESPTWLRRSIAPFLQNTDISLGDFNNDGWMDFAYVEKWSEHHGIYFNEAYAEGGPYITWQGFGLGDIVDPNQILGGDIDGDTDLDVISVDAGKIVFFQNNGTSNTTWSNFTVATIAGVRYAAIADLDGDGDNDIAAIASNDTIYWLENDGAASPSFTLHTLAYAPDNPQRIVAGDMDGDGDIDLVVCSSDDDTLVWLENDGAADPTFAHSVIATNIDGHLQLVDLDQDGDLDILTASEPLNEVMYYANNGSDDPIFTKRKIIDADFNGAVWVTAVDYDFDGDIDVVSTAANDGDIEWYRNEGGQYGLTTADVTPVRVYEEDLAATLKTTIDHRGRNYGGGLDHAEEIASLSLLFDDGTGAIGSRVLTTAEIDALLDSLRIYRDDGDGVFDAGDTIAANIASITLTGGVLIVTFADGDPAAQIAAAGSASFFVVLDTATDAHLEPLHQLRLTHLVTGAVRTMVEDAATDQVVVQEWQPTNFTSQVIVIQQLPHITSVTSTAVNGTYGIGASIPITVNFSEAVTLTGTLTLQLSGGGTAVINAFANLTSVTVNYVVAAGQSTGDLNVVGYALGLGSTLVVATGHAVDFLAPNTVSLASTKAIVIDGTRPVVTGVTSTAADGTYDNGATIQIVVSFDSNVNVSGVPRIALNSGAFATYVSGTGTSNLVFSYFLTPGEESPDLDFVSTASLTLNGGSINEAGLLAGVNTAVLTLPAPGGTGSISDDQQIVIDTHPPQVTSVHSTAADGTYRNGDVIQIVVTFDWNVDVTGTPQLALNSGGTANYLSGTGTNTLTFRYTVGGGQDSLDLDYASISALSLNGGTIAEAGAGGVAANLSLPTPGSAGSISDNQAIVVDSDPPQVVNVTSNAANGIYRNGASIQIVVNFDFAVTVTGVPRLALNSGGVANYTSGSGSTSLVFTYVVAVGQNSLDLDYTSTGALTLNGGSIVDAGAIPDPAILTLPTPGSLGSISDNQQIVIDTDPPVVTGVTSSSPNGLYRNGSTIQIVVSFDYAVAASGVPQLALNSGGVANYTSGSGSSALVFTYIVAPGQNSPDLDFASSAALTLNGGSIVEAGVVSGAQAAVLTLPAPGGPGSISDNQALVVNTIPPQVVGVYSTAENGVYRTGETLQIIVSFNYAVKVTGVPLLALNSGGTAAYVAGTGTSTLVFNYTVGAGQSSNDLDVASIAALVLNGGSIVEAGVVSGAQAALLTLPAPGGVGSISDDQAIVINTRQEYFAVAAGGGNIGSRVFVYDADSRQEVARFYAFSKNFKGGVRVAVADVNGDRVDDIIVASGPGLKAQVKVINGSSLWMANPNGTITNAALIYAFKPFGSSYKGGVYVAAADFNRDGRADIVTGTGTEIAGRVYVYDAGSLFRIANIKPFGNYQGGVTVAAGDLNRDGAADLVVGRATGNSTIKMYNGADMTSLGSLKTFSGSYRAGVNIALADTNGDGQIDIIVGAGEDYKPLVRVFEGASRGLMSQFFAFESKFKGGVRVAAANVDRDAADEIIAVPGPGRKGAVRLFNLDASLVDEIMAAPSKVEGLFAG